MKRPALFLLVLLALPAASPAQPVPAIRSFEMISNGGGPVLESDGFVATGAPSGYEAWSADWYRDVLFSQDPEGSILGHDGGMQVAGGWYFVVAMPREVTDDFWAQNQWTMNGARNFVLDAGIYEIRFTSDGGKASFINTGAVGDVPFELWYLGTTVDDISDDVRMIPRLADFESPAGPDQAFSFSLDHMASDGLDDPNSDGIFFLMPADRSPGHAGYDAFAGTGDLTGATEHLARIVLMNWDRHQGESALGAGDGDENAMPEAGTTFRININEFAPTCQIVGASAFPTYELELQVRDRTGIGSISEVWTDNATVTVLDFIPGERQARVAVTAVDPSRYFGAELTVADLGGNAASCTPQFDPASIAIHDVGNVILAIQANSNLGTYGTPIQEATGLSAFWPRGVGPDHIYDGNLWVGTIIDGHKLVVDNEFGSPGDWTRTPGSSIDVSAVISDQDITVTYDDADAYSPAIGLRVNQHSYQWSHPTRDDFIILDYLIEHTGPGLLTDVYAGLWLDPDINDDDLSTPGDATTDRAGYDPERGLLYLWDDTGLGGYLGVEVLGDSPSSAKAYRNVVGEHPGFDSDKYDRFLRAGFPGIADTQSDWRLIITAAPFDVDDEHSVTFGLVMGEDLADLQANSDMMGIVYHLEAAGYVIGEWVGDGTLGKGPGKALLSKLQVALSSIERANDRAAINHLGAFINNVDGLVDEGVLDDAAGQYLIGHAMAIIELLGGDAGKRGIEPVTVETPGGVDLAQNYPNPFNPTTLIRFELPETARVRLLVLDVLGREVAWLVDGIRQAGAFEEVFNAATLPSGVYFYRLETPHTTITRRMLLVR